MSIELTPTQLDDIWDANADLHTEQNTARAYYDGEHDIVERTETYADGTDKTNLVANWCEYGVNAYTGALTQTPFQVTGISSQR